MHKVMYCKCRYSKKGKSFPLQGWSGPEGSRKLRFPDFMTTAQDGGKVVTLTHRPSSLPVSRRAMSSVHGGLAECEQRNGGHLEDVILPVE